jgi:hypothetical protein
MSLKEDYEVLNTLLNEAHDIIEKVKPTQKIYRVEFLIEKAQDILKKLINASIAKG